jgi:hypothetical protein
MRRLIGVLVLLTVLVGCAPAAMSGEQATATVRPQPTAPAQVPAYAELPQGKTAEGYHRLGAEGAARELTVYGDYL